VRVAVIPARGGSKRIPRKNIRQFGNKPMIAHSLTAAKASGLFEHVLVSTDDEEIAGVARQYGAEVPFKRPAELADDYANTTDVVAHAIRCMRAYGWRMDAVCCIYATAPFLLSEDLAGACRLLEGGQWEYVFAATSFGYPIQRALRRAPNGGMPMLQPEHWADRSQDLEEAFHDAGQFYWARPEIWEAASPVFSTKSTAVVLPHWRVQDIDTEEDWKRAETIFAALRLVADGV
jgi:pseudaminic acid cytidylyltransferase